MKIQDNSGQYRITIPKSIAKAKGWKQGTEVILSMDKEGNVLIIQVPEGGDDT